MSYYIIEHPTRGTLRDWEYEPDRQGGFVMKPMFSWSGHRNDPVKAFQFHSIASAQEKLAEMPERLRADCQIRDSSNNWEPIDLEMTAMSNRQLGQAIVETTRQQDEIEENEFDPTTVQRYLKRLQREFKKRQVEGRWNIQEFRPEE